MTSSLTPPPDATPLTPEQQAAVDTAVAKAIEVLPAKLRSFGTQYAPALIAMGVDGLLTWLRNIRTTGDVSAAYLTVLTTKDDAALLAEGQQLTKEWDTAWANDEARRAALQAEGSFLVTKILLPLASAILVAL